jgi:hypothetical protein
VVVLTSRLERQRQERHADLGERQVVENDAAGAGAALDSLWAFVAIALAAAVIGQRRMKGVRADQKQPHDQDPLCGR